jgi:RNA polymerase sigma factor (sigma-70 family)
MQIDRGKNKDASQYLSFEAGSESLIAILVEDNLGWATSIAKAVARGWNLDWQLDGIDGGAFEALLFCARRYDPAMGVPFRGYARRRIHESCTDEARKSKSWQQSTGGDDSEVEMEARELSAKIFDLFPELRDGFLPTAVTAGEEQTAIKSSIRQLLTGASLISAFNESTTENQENLVDYKRLIELIAGMEPVHQDILWGIYYQGTSMRGLAEEWGLDDLSIIREHKEILAFLAEKFESGKAIPESAKLKVRRGLKAKALELRKSKDKGAFAKILGSIAACVCIFFNIQLLNFV